jgi:hypothetical protein
MLKIAAIGAVAAVPAMRSAAQSPNGQTVPTRYTITIEVLGNGTIDPAGPVSAPAGGSQVFTLTAAKGWVYSGGAIASGMALYACGPGPGQCTVSNVQSNCVLLVKFVSTNAE